VIGNIGRAFALLDRRARLQLCLLAAMTLVGAVFEAAGIGLVFPFIKIIAEPEWLQGSRWYPDIVAWFGPLDHHTVVVAIGLGMIALFVVKNAYMLAFYITQYTVTFGNVARYSTKMLAHYLRSPYTMHLERNSAEMVRNVRELPQDLFNAVTALLGFMTEALVMALICAVLFAAEPVATATAGLLLVGATGIFYTIAGRLLRDWGGQRLWRNGQVQLALQQALNGIKESRVLGREGYFVARFTEQTQALMELQRSIQTVAQLPRLSVELAMMTGMIAVVLVMAGRGGGSSEMLPKLAVFAAAAFRLLPSINRMTQALTELKVSTAPLEALFADMPRDAAHATADAALVRPRLERALELEGVSFTYPASAEPAVRDIDLCIRRGDTIGLVGPSGAGKSTLVDIILGLLVPDCGRILLDGQVIATGGGWHGAVGYVPQSIYITDDTVRRNVAFGIEDGAIDDDAVRRALALARLDDFVAGLPSGLETCLAEDGIRLSGGQRQRIGIARALYHDPDLLVLDEATSALDPITEREIGAAVRALHRSKTVIIIAHRLSTVRHCDCLLLIEGGRVADRGGFDDLAARNPSFQRLVAALEMANTANPVESP